MLSKARNLVQSLESHLQKQILFPFEDDERGNWNYKPAPRQGVPLRSMSPRQRRAAVALLESALSRQGAEKARGIMTLEAILGELEGREQDDRTRDPEGYFFTLFGTLVPGQPWGWRIDGHHLSLTFTSVGSGLVAVTPSFMGANPAEVPHGPRQGWRVLREEEDLARQLLHAFTPSQRELILLAPEAPPDIITGTSRDLQLDAPAGLPGAEMTEAQKESLLQLVAMFARRFREDLAEAHLQRACAAGVERLHFAWAGGSRRGAGHYYRIQGPTLLIEYDNTQNNANHIHTVMRDPERDFGRDLLRRHYQECAHGL